MTTVEKLDEIIDEEMDENQDGWRKNRMEVGVKVDKKIGIAWN